MRQFKSLILDLLLIAFATALALVIRDNLEFSWPRQRALLPYLLITLGTAVVVLTAAGISKTIWRFSGLSEYGRLVASCVAIILVSVLIGFATLRMENVPRSLPVLQAIVMIAIMVGVRVGLRARRVQRRSQGAVSAVPAAQETVLVVGFNAVTELFMQAVAESAEPKIAIAGVIGRNERHTGQLFRGHSILGTPEDICQVVRDLEVHGVGVDRIVVTLPLDRISQATQRALCEIEDGTQIRVDYFSERLGFARQTSGWPESQEKPRDCAQTKSRRTTAEEQELAAASLRGYWKFKRAGDFVFATMLLFALGPLILLVGLLTAFWHGLPVLFWQQRPGLNGRPFKVYKFRSLLSAHNEHGHRLSDDQRETWLGRFMRANRIDELPQLVNILRGHMSFVGPRPLLPGDQLDQFKGRLLVRPGLTGWAQVNGGKSVKAPDKMALDVWYIKNASFRLDIKIMLLTANMVLRGERENPDAVEQAWLDLKRHKA